MWEHITGWDFNLFTLRPGANLTESFLLHTASKTLGIQKQQCLHEGVCVSGGAFSECDSLGASGALWLSVERCHACVYLLRVLLWNNILELNAKSVTSFSTPPPPLEPTWSWLVSLSKTVNVSPLRKEWNLFFLPTSFLSLLKSFQGSRPTLTYLCICLTWQYFNEISFQKNIQTK